MTISQLHARAAHLKGELQATRDLIAQETHDPAALSAELARTRAYAFSAQADSVEESIAGCAESLGRYGFCVIDDVIPSDQIEAIRDEIQVAQAISAKNIQSIQGLHEETGLGGQALLDQAAAHQVELRPVRRAGHPPKPPNDIVWMPQYARQLANPVVTAVARRVLDDHLRIAQLHPRFIEGDKADGSKGGFGSAALRGRANTREWHTDWPHDLSAYGGNNPEQNAGCIRQPFPDMAMCLVMIWYLTDVDENSGGTWVVPGSFRDKRNPRGPADGITVTAPIPGDMQVTAKAGSVYIQDSRSWHASPMHNTGQKRIAVVNRWCPWWLAVDDYAPGGAFSTSIVCRPLSQAEYRALPADLQPYMRHLCPDEQDTLQQPVLDRAQAARDRNQLGFGKLEEDPDSLEGANDHIRVPIRP
ncbi:MAG: hypothetical protein GKR89_37880 [Candidatus Latescibacteria bacterium]|nr:hypothetical protein [Candidatus Latescibacterota bacterium]